MARSERRRMYSRTIQSYSGHDIFSINHSHIRNHQKMMYYTCTIPSYTMYYGTIVTANSVSDARASDHNHFRLIRCF